MPRNARRLALPALAALLLLSAAGCQKDPPPEPPAEAPASPDTAVAASPDVGAAQATAPADVSAPSVSPERARLIQGPAGMTLDQAAALFEAVAPVRGFMRAAPVRDAQLFAALEGALSDEDQAQLDAFFGMGAFNPLADLSGVVLTSRSEDLELLDLSHTYVIAAVDAPVSAALLNTFDARASALMMELGVVGHPPLVLLGQGSSVALEALAEGGAQRETFSTSHALVWQPEAEGGVATYAWPGGAIRLRAPDRASAEARVAAVIALWDRAANAAMKDAPVVDADEAIRLQAPLRGGALSLEGRVGERVELRVSLTAEGAFGFVLRQLAEQLQAEPASASSLLAEVGLPPALMEPAELLLSRATFQQEDAGVSARATLPVADLKAGLEGLTPSCENLVDRLIRCDEGLKGRRSSSVASCEEEVRAHPESALIFECASAPSCDELLGCILNTTRRAKEAKLEREVEAVLATGDLSGADVTALSYGCLGVLGERAPARDPELVTACERFADLYLSQLAMILIQQRDASALILDSDGLPSHKSLCWDVDTWLEVLPENPGAKQARARCQELELAGFARDAEETLSDQEHLVFLPQSCRQGLELARALEPSPFTDARKEALIQTCVARFSKAILGMDALRVSADYCDTAPASLLRFIAEHGLQEHAAGARAVEAMANLGGGCLSAAADAGLEVDAVTLTLKSVPEGAVVRRGERLIGVTPFELHGAQSQSPFELSFSRDGYQSQVLSVSFAEDSRHEVTLVKAHQVARPSATKLSREDVLAVMRPALAAARGCPRAKSAQKLTLSWRILPNGGVSSVDVRSAEDAALPAAPCVLKIVEGLRFPAHDQEPVRVLFPFKVPAAE